MLNSFYTKKNKFIRADFNGRYVAELSKSTSIANFSEISIVDGRSTMIFHIKRPKYTSRMSMVYEGPEDCHKLAQNFMN